MGSLIAVVCILGYCVLLASTSSATLPVGLTFHSHLPYLADKPMGEDGYYMLTVADNIATQGRILYNRGIEATGIQPLATVVFAGVDWFVHKLHGTEWDLIRWVLLLGGALFVMFAFQMGNLAARLAAPGSKDVVFMLAFLLVLTDYTLFRLFTYGLETGIYLCCLALCFSSMDRIGVAGRTTTAEAARLGVAAGLAGLARIDFGLVFAILMVILLSRRWISLFKAMICGAIALVIVSPWFWFLHAVTGSWIPSSGKAESTMITLQTVWPRVKVMLIMTAGHIAPWSYGGMSRLTTAVTILSVALIVGLFFSAVGRQARAQSVLAFRLGRVWLPGLVALMFIYTIFFSSVQFYYRYMAPVALVTIPLLAILLGEVRWVRTHMLMAEAILFCFFAAWTVGSLHTGHLGNSNLVTAGYVRANYPNAHVGAFQSGVVGYFNRNVENLDGKLNLEAWNATRQHQLPEFIDQEGIDVLVDWASVIHHYLPQNYIDSEWQPCPVPMTGTEGICLVRRHLKMAGSASPRKAFELR